MISLSDTGGVDDFKAILINQASREKLGEKKDEQTKKPKPNRNKTKTFLYWSGLLVLTVKGKHGSVPRNLPVFGKNRRLP